MTTTKHNKILEGMLRFIWVKGNVFNQIKKNCVHIKAKGIGHLRLHFDLATKYITTIKLFSTNPWVFSTISSKLFII